MSRSPFVVDEVPPWTLRQLVPVPGHVRTVLPAVSTWPRSVALKRGAKVRSAEAAGARATRPAIATIRAVSQRPAPRPLRRLEAGTTRHPEPGTDRRWQL